MTARLLKILLGIISYPELLEVNQVSEASLGYGRVRNTVVMGGQRWLDNRIRDPRLRTLAPSFV